METAQPADDTIILPTSSVDIPDVSRMGFDLRRKAMVGDRNKVDPQEADERFVQLLVQLLEKVRGPHVSSHLTWHVYGPHQKMIVNTLPLCMLVHVIDNCR